jgi:pantoate--beta-alanine ligase
MITTGSIAKIRKIIIRAKKLNKTIGFVPTMGALHEGHLSLIKQAKKECDFTAVSIFVNPTQFGLDEDYKKYPREVNKDKKLLEKEDIDLIFYPSVAEMYPVDFSTYVQEGALNGCLCGKSRPGHFRGVCTIVTKLFNVITPDIAYFGHKDYQQAKIIQRMARDLNFALKVKIMPTVRESDGLAKSSRNAYLDIEQRKKAVCLYLALIAAKRMVAAGERNPEKVIARMKKVIFSQDDVKVDYISIVDADSLKEVKKIKDKILIALAVYVGKIRLIDNFVLEAR